MSQADEVPIYSSPPVLCERCGHDLKDHERTHHDHGVVCWGQAPEGSEPCSCGGCQQDGPSERRCPCRSFRAAKPKAVDAAARESRGAL
jgi:hypothetical protein